MPSELYDLDLPAAIEKIKAHEAKLVCLQLPDGLKQFGDEIVSALNEACPETRIVMWGGSCYGACDLPLEVKRMGVDLLIQWGHSPWVY